MIHAREDYNRRIQDAENKIPAHEPVFLLRAQDQFAAQVLRTYIQTVRGFVSQEHINRLEEHLEAMLEWEVKKIPDTTPEQFNGTDKEEVRAETETPGGTNHSDGDNPGDRPETSGGSSGTEGDSGRGEQTQANVGDGGSSGERPAGQ